MHIDAKPTKLNGVQFRSRLEARWAVFLGSHLSVEKAFYEPITLEDTKTKHTYTPDFEVSFSLGTVYLEIKPTTISFKAIEEILTWGCALNYSLIVMCGSFYEDNITGFAHPSADGELVQGAAALLNKKDHAYKLAKNWRFDLG